MLNFAWPKVQFNIFASASHLNNHPVSLNTNICKLIRDGNGALHPLCALAALALVLHITATCYTTKVVCRPYNKHIHLMANLIKTMKSSI